MGVVGVIRSGKVRFHIVRVFGDNEEWIWRSDLVSAVSQN